MRMKRWQLLIVAAFCLSACGQTGPLYLPEDAPEEVPEETPEPNQGGRG